MKFSHALILASSLAFFACGGDDDSPSAAPSTPTSVSSSSVPGSSSSGQSSPAYDCTVSDGVKVVYPTKGEKFKIGQTIDVVFGTTIDEGYRIVFKKNADDMGVDLFNESYDLTGPADGKTCHTVKVKLDAEKSVEATSTGIIRVIPYDTQKKGANSAEFTVTK